MKTKSFITGEQATTQACSKGAKVDDFGPTHYIATDCKGRSVIYPKGNLRPSTAGMIVKIFKWMAFLTLILGGYAVTIRIP